MEVEKITTYILKEMKVRYRNGVKIRQDALRDRIQHLKNHQDSEECENDTYHVA